MYVIDASSNTLVDTIDVPAPGTVFTNFLALNLADDKLYYSAAGSLVSIDAKTDRIVSERALDTVAGLTFDSTRQRLYVLGYDGFLTALDAKHIDDLPSALPPGGGPPASAGRGAWPELSGLALISVAALMIRMALARRKPMP
ncbi:MAG: hypothetical protein M3O21_05215 [Chloroflexota bacterium]|nr:hypothetical protein [Chloroflexota bacterium]